VLSIESIQMKTRPSSRFGRIVPALLCSAMVACGGSGSESQPSTSAPSASYTIAGTVTGLDSGLSLTLLNNGNDALTVDANSTFSFTDKVAFNSAYSVSISAQPFWQYCAVSNGSGVATANESSVVVSCAAAEAVVSTFAGSGTSGAADGTGSAASFYIPLGVAVDASGTLYVADTENNEIRRITAAGVVSTFAGSTSAGSSNGAGSAASFSGPSGVAIDSTGNVYVADQNNQLIRKISPAGVVSTLAGSGSGGAADGNGTAASFRNPSGIAVDATGNVYVADAGNNEIRKITSSGDVSTLAGSTAAGAVNGTGSAASFSAPTGVAVDASGNVYVADSNNNEIRKITPKAVVTTLAGSGSSGSVDGTGAAASFSSPEGLTSDAFGNVYVADSFGEKIRKITPGGGVTTLAGSGTQGSTNGTGTAALFRGPGGIAIDASGNIFVADSFNDEIRLISPGP
jgi:sugar lactone lactonase YvrE